MNGTQPRCSRASAVFLLLAGALIAPLWLMSLQGIRKADALNYLGALLLAVIGASIRLSVGLSIRAIRRGSRSLAQYVVLVVALWLLALPSVLASRAP